MKAKRPEYITTDLNGTVLNIKRNVKDCVVNIDRNEDTGMYSYIIVCGRTFDNWEAALNDARRMIEEHRREPLAWVPLYEM